MTNSISMSRYTVPLIVFSEKKIDQLTIKHDDPIPDVWAVSYDFWTFMWFFRPPNSAVVSIKHYRKMKSSSITNKRFLEKHLHFQCDPKC